MGNPGFIVYHEFEEQVSMLSNEEAGILLKAVFEYEKTGTIIDMPPMTKLVFVAIRRTLDLNASKYGETCERNRENGKKGGRPKTQNNPAVIIETEDSQAVIIETQDNPSVTEDNPEKPRGYFENPKKPNKTQTQTKTKKEKEREGDSCEPPPAPAEVKAKKFIVPSVDEIAEYCRERGAKNIDPQRFHDYYTSKGWIVGKARMKDWQAAVRNWERSDFNFSDSTDRRTRASPPEPAETAAKSDWEQFAMSEDKVNEILRIDEEKYGYGEKGG